MKKITITILMLYGLINSSQPLNAQPTLIHQVKGYTLTGSAGNSAQLKSFSSLVFEQGKVLFTGDDTEALTRYPNAKKIDGKGATLLPGLTDAHGHLLGLGQTLLEVDLRGSASEAEAVAAVTDYARKTPKLRWLTGGGWNQVLWPNKQYPTKASLDKLSLNKPIVLSRIDSHAVWVNSKALEIAGIDRNTPDPEGGQIIKDANGDPTGVLIDNAEQLVRAKIPRASAIDLNYALDKAFNHLLSLGITSVHDAGIGNDLYQLYQQRQRTKQLPVRIYAMLSGSDSHLSHWLNNGFITDTSDQLLIRSVKLYADGALGSRGAALIEPYSDQADHKGLLVTKPSELNQRVKQVISSGFQANIHAIGDLGNRVVIEAIRNATTDNPKTANSEINKTAKDNTANNHSTLSRTNVSETAHSLRHRIEHAQVVNIDDLKQIKALNLIASMQPTHATSDMNMAEDRIGAKRIIGAYAWRTLLDQGTIIASGSDFPVELANPFHGIHAAVTRQNQQNQPQNGWKPEQKMTLIEALRSFTLDAAYAAHQEKTLGTLEPGKWADFILINQDIFAIDPSELWQVEVQQTWIAGKQLFVKPL